ncbi:MAG: twin-arginine translocase subunit TatC [Armatimonadetes bacterium]|nr:twin-arginine translocase subunit TatC [Armatimonadota bacterium]
MAKRNLPDNPDEFRLSLVEHLEELRTRLMRCLAVVAVTWIIGWYVQPSLYVPLEKIVMSAVPKGVDSKVVFGSITDPFMLRMNNSFVIGLIIASPFILLQLWGFITPGLKEKERKPFQLAAPICIGLFALGTFFCWLILPSAYTWFASYLTDFNGAALFQNPNVMISFCMKMLLAFGVGFQLPVVVFVLYRFGVITPAALNKHWRHATVFIFIAASILTPSNDIFSMLMMAIPLTILFFGSVLAIKVSASRLPWPDELAVLD